MFFFVVGAAKRQQYFTLEEISCIPLMIKPLQVTGLSVFLAFISHPLGYMYVTDVFSIVATSCSSAQPYDVVSKMDQCTVMKDI